MDNQRALAAKSIPSTARESSVETLLERALRKATCRSQTSAIALMLHVTIACTGARFGVIFLKKGHTRRQYYGQYHDGTPIGRPDKLLDVRQVQQAFRLKRPLVKLRGPSQREWSFALPIAIDTDRNALLCLGGALPDPWSTQKLDLEQALSWAEKIAAGVRLEELKNELQTLRECTADPQRIDNEQVIASISDEETVNTQLLDAEPIHLAEIEIPEIIGHSPAVRNLRRTAKMLSCSDVPVLIEGESGTGKELVARAIHRLSKRSHKILLCENCGAIPHNLVESELFGHEAGAFTGAGEGRAGIFERSDGGTVFLDEVGEMDLEVQKKLLRVLQEREVRRIGGESSIQVDFRLISATNRVVEELVANGLFREDLYFRLNVATVTLPSLRTRVIDIPQLTQHFNRVLTAELDRPPLEFTKHALDCLMSYNWPGNIRELRNEVWRLASTGCQRVRMKQLSGRVLRNIKNAPRSLLRDRPDLTLDQVEREFLRPVVIEAIKKSNNNYAEAARKLNVSRSGLYRRMKRYGIPTKRQRPK